MSSRTDFDTIERCPHDEENPYVQISRDLIRDASLSPESRWFVCYLLSHDKSFKVSIPWVIRTQDMCKDRMYRIIDECIDAGYVQRITFKEKGLQRVKYLVSERPKFKKCLPRPEKQDPVFQDPEKQDAKKQQSSLKKEQEKETTTSPTPSKGKDAAVSLLQKKIIGQLEKSKLTKEQKARAIWFYLTNGDACHAKTVKNPVGFVIDAIKNDRDVEVQAKKQSVLKRKEWAENNEKTFPDGYSLASPSAYVIIKGVYEITYPYDEDHAFWLDKGL